MWSDLFVKLFTSGTSLQIRKIFSKEPDDDVYNFMKGFGHIWKLWVLLSTLHFIL